MIDRNSITTPSLGVQSRGTMSPAYCALCARYSGMFSPLYHPIMRMSSVAWRPSPLNLQPIHPCQLSLRKRHPLSSLSSSAEPGPGSCQVRGGSRRGALLQGSGGAGHRTQDPRGHQVRVGAGGVALFEKSSFSWVWGGVDIGGWLAQVGAGMGPSLVAGCGWSCFGLVPGLAVPAGLLHLKAVNSVTGCMYGTWSPLEVGMKLAPLGTYS